MPETNEIRIENSSEQWVASHPADKIAGPSLLSCRGIPLFSDCRCDLGDISDRLAVVDSCRAYNKANLTIVQSEGQLPYGSGISFVHRYRYSGRFVRVITDIRIPRGTHIRDRLSVGTLELPGQWQRFRTVSTAGTQRQLGPWQNTPPDLTLPVVGVILQSQEGMQLELGLGTDLWRWERGLDGHTAILLQQGERGLELRRFVCDESADPAPRGYRFSWYAAWQPAVPELSMPQSRIHPIWKSDHSLDVRRIREVITAAPADTVLEVDFAATDWGSSMIRTPQHGKPTPCLTCNKVITRLKRIVRQIAEIDNLGVHFAGLTAGRCSNAAHVGRHGKPLAHWDMPDLLEFSLWIRQCLGPDRRISYESNDSPAMNALFVSMENNLV